MPREEMHICKPHCVNSQSEVASHVLCGYSVSSQWNVGCTHQTLKVGEKYPFPQLSKEVRSSGTLDLCTVFIRSGFVFWKILQCKVLFLIHIWSIDGSEYGLFPPQCEQTWWDSAPPARPWPRLPHWHHDCKCFIICLFYDDVRWNVPNASFSVLIQLGERHHLEPPAEHGKGGPRKGKRWPPRGGTSGRVIPENTL